jgi:hypothetical protein
MSTKHGSAKLNLVISVKIVTALMTNSIMAAATDSISSLPQHTFWTIKQTVLQQLFPNKRSFLQTDRQTD